MERSSYVYILASECYGTLYVGVTADLVQRVWQHREGFADGFTKAMSPLSRGSPAPLSATRPSPRLNGDIAFTKTYKVKRLVWFETHGDIMGAISREKRIKKWKRAWKIALIQMMNPGWRDLYDDFTA